MAVDRDTFFAELDHLSVQEIEQRLATWDMERLKLAQDYVRRLASIDRSPPDETEAIRDANTAALVAAQAARSANTRATAGLILSAGAMAAAVLCGVIVVMN